MSATPAPVGTDGIAVYFAGDPCFRWSLRISPVCFRAVGTVAVLATIPLAHAAAAVQLLALTFVMVLMPAAEEEARRRQPCGPASHQESITH